MSRIETKLDPQISVRLQELGFTKYMQEDNFEFVAKQELDHILIMRVFLDQDLNFLERYEYDYMEKKISFTQVWVNNMALENKDGTCNDLNQELLVNQVATSLQGG